MGEKRQKNQEQLDFAFVEGSEAFQGETKGTESLKARRETENPAGNQRVMENFCHCSRVDSLTNRTAVYGPVRTVVWEGRRSDLPPYPDLRACAT